tara:strand:+ start:542 stop:736 length:195 start_codon:yes stop_codon:yes gene_type:complete
MFILAVISICLFLFFIFKQLQIYLDKKKNKTNLIEAAIFYLFFFRLITVALMIGFVLYWLAGVF